MEQEEEKTKEVIRLLQEKMRLDCPGMSEDEFMQELNKYPLITHTDSTSNQKAAPLPPFTASELEEKWKNVRLPSSDPRPESALPHLMKQYLSQYYEPETIQLILLHVLKQHAKQIEMLSTDDVERLAIKLKTYQKKNQQQ